MITVGPVYPKPWDLDVLTTLDLRAKHHIVICAISIMKYKLANKFTIRTIRPPSNNQVMHTMLYCILEVFLCGANDLLCMCHAHFYNNLFILLLRI